MGSSGPGFIPSGTSLSLPLFSSVSPGGSHRRACPIPQPILTKAGNGCGASACHWREEGLEFGLMFSISTIVPWLNLRGDGATTTQS